MDQFNPPAASEPGAGNRERVIGPFKGYHIASLGCRADGLDGGFVGYYKICRGHPTTTGRLNSCCRAAA